MRMDKSTDTILLDRIKQGDEQAFTHLFDEYYPALCFFANRFLSDMDISRSLVQQFFIDFWLSRERINIKTSLKPYLYQSVKNRSVDFIRQQDKEGKALKRWVSDLEEPFRDLIEEAELNDRINRTMNSLPEKCREVFLLSRFEQLKNKEIALKLGISVKTVEMQISIALKRIREDLRKIQVFQFLSFYFFKKK